MEKFESTKVEILKSPVDVILDGVILSVDKGLLSEMIPKERQAGWDNLDKVHLTYQFECQYEGNHFKGDDRVRFYDPAPSGSNIAKLQNKYGGKIPGVGDTVKIVYGSDGFGKIKLD